MSDFLKLECPYCKHKQSPLDNVHDNHEDQCEQCRMWFVYGKRTVIQYVTNKADCLNNLSQHDWVYCTNEMNSRQKYCRDCSRIEFLQSSEF